MKSIDTNQVIQQVNRCYLDYDPQFLISEKFRVPEFAKFLEETGGLRVGFMEKTNEYGRFGYELTQAVIIDEPAFTMWMLRWS